MKNIAPSVSKYLENYNSFKLKDVSGRYINYGHIESSLNQFSKSLTKKLPGKSTLGNPIPSFIIGKGSIKVLAWSQMHGNESTTTKAILDILNAVYLKKSIFEDVLAKCTICIIPMLNPDGAKAYTRENANSVDLNRDAQDLSQVESQILREVFDNFKPNFCFNLHDQRTIFSAGNKPSPATLSFLTPAMDKERTISESRINSMKVIAGVVRELDSIIPESIGRYDDAFNLNCTGDTFQNFGVPTILFEAGHYPEDYSREETRKLIGAAIFSALNFIASQEYERTNYEDYSKIPENRKLYVDVLLKNALVENEIVNIGIQYQEILEGDEIQFVPKVQTLGYQLNIFGHKVFDCRKQEVKLKNDEKFGENVIVKEIYINDEVLAIN